MAMNLHKISSDLDIFKVFLISHRVFNSGILPFFLSWSDWRLPYMGKRYRECKAKFLGNCPVTVIHRVITTYRALIYRFDYTYSCDSKTKLHASHFSQLDLDSSFHY